MLNNILTQTSMDDYKYLDSCEKRFCSCLNVEIYYINQGRLKQKRNEILNNNKQNSNNIDNNLFELGWKELEKTLDDDDRNDPNIFIRAFLLSVKIVC